MNDAQHHWNTVYQTKSFNESSWFEETPALSISFFDKTRLPRTARLIDVGAGESRLVDYWLAQGYRNITLVDISEKALERTRHRLGQRGKSINWVVADAATFVPSEPYDFWHDRATLHFLTQEPHARHYAQTIGQYLRPAGHLVVGTFDENGPDRCSGLIVRHYSETTLSQLLAGWLRKVECLTYRHQTPARTEQAFIFCHFQQSATAIPTE